jgi:hypothetical protein
MSITSDETSQSDHEDKPLGVADFPDIQRFSFRQMRILHLRLEEYPTLSRDDRPEFFQECFEELWICENPSWDWDERTPRKEDNPKYHWTKEASHYL